MTVTRDETTALTTQPEAPSPRPSGQRLAPFRRAWRQLTSMRTALLLLFLLALAAVPGAFLPQRGLNPVRVEEYLVERPTLGPWLDHYNFTRPHGSLSHKPPGSRLTNAPRNYS